MERCWSSSSHCQVGKREISQAEMTNAIIATREATGLMSADQEEEGLGVAVFKEDTRKIFDN